eukprot:1888467-Pyramimonas_sp.AAC.1
MTNRPRGKGRDLPGDAVLKKSGRRMSGVRSGRCCCAAPSLVMRSALLAAWLAHCGHGRHGQDAVQ